MPGEWKGAWRGVSWREWPEKVFSSCCMEYQLHGLECRVHVLKQVHMQAALDRLLTGRSGLHGYLEIIGLFNW